MANDVTLPATGDVIATEEVASREYQLIKVKWGGTGVVTDIDATTPLPVATYVGTFASSATAGADANSTSTVTTALTCSKASRVGVQVVGATGTHGTHVVTLQGSVDGANFASLGVTVTGEGIAEVAAAVSSVRAKVTTAEGATSTVDITVYCK